MNTARKSTRITRAQIRAIKTLQGRLRLDDETYREFLNEAYGVRSCTKLTREQAGSAIEALQGQLERGPDYLGARDARVRRDAWNAELFSAGALRGLADSDRGAPPTRNRVKQTAALLWRLCGRLYNKSKCDDPVKYAKRIIRDAIGRWGRISTAEECRAVRRAAISALRQRGWYPEKGDRR